MAQEVIPEGGGSYGRIEQIFLVKMVTSSPCAFYQEIEYANEHIVSIENKAIFTDNPEQAHSFITYGEAEATIKNFLEEWGSMRSVLFQIEKVYSRGSR